MAHTKSAEKRARQNEKRRARNRAIKSRMKTAIKKLLQVIETKDLNSIDALLNAAKSEIYKAATKGVIKKNTAARYVSRLSKKVYKLKSSAK